MPCANREIDAHGSSTQAKAHCVALHTNKTTSGTSLSFGTITTHADHNTSICCVKSAHRPARSVSAFNVKKGTVEVSRARLNPGLLTSMHLIDRKLGSRSMTHVATLAEHGVRVGGCVSGGAFVSMTA